MSGMGTDVTGCLHLLLSASLEARKDCDKCLGAEDTVLMLADGVTVLLQEPIESPQGTHARRCYARADLAARGLLLLAQARGVDVLEDSEIAGLLERHAHCLSWK